MDNHSSDQTNLIPLALLSTSLFQRKKQTLVAPSTPSLSTPSSSIGATPIAIPQATITELFQPENPPVKKETDDSQRLSLNIPSYQGTTNIDNSDSETEPTQMPIYYHSSKESGGTGDRFSFRESSMFPQSRPHKETNKFNNRLGMSVPPPDSSYMRSRRDDHNIYFSNLRDDRNNAQPILDDNQKSLERKGGDWNKGLDPFLRDQSRGGRRQYDTLSQYENSRDTSGSSRSLGRDQSMEFGSNKRRNESTSPKPRKRTGSMTEDVRYGIADVSLDKSRLSEFANNSGASNTISTQSPTASEDSDYDQATQRNTAMAIDHHSKSVYSTIVTNANGGTDVDMSPRKSDFKLFESKRKNKRRRTAKETSGETSDSDSSSSESESSSDESDTPYFAGASGLKLHGQIHDLMLELERTRTKYAKYCEKAKASSKRIRNISKKLERRFRDLSDSTSNSRGTPAPEKSMIASRSSSDRITQGTFNSSQSVNTTISSTPVSRNAPASSKGRLGASRPRLAQINDRIAVASLDVVETLTNVHSDIRNKTFGRKPRCMLHHVSIAGPDMEEVMVTSSLDGSIQFWDLEKRRITSTIPKGPLNMPWAEDMCWISRNTLAVASAHKEGVPMPHQLTLVHVQKAKSNSSINWTIQSLDQKPHDTSKGGIVCLSALTADRSGFSLATAAMDKQIVRWKFTPPNSDGDCIPSQQTLIHNKHTSTIQGLCYTPHNNILFSGGSDCKVIGWDMERSEVVYDYKSKERGRINSITPNPVDPNLLLIGHATTNYQLSLHDIRQRFDDPVLRFGFQCADNLSKQVLPSWHPGGAIVSSGTQSDPKINIWDIRWRDVHRGAGQSIDGQAKRVFKAAFHPTKPFITSMSADSSLAFM
ncbi:hypothetical protein FBU30_006148 [Linnemannia zychae]|nr:hypothetical protein FBU30_006148 [Linnemannia zychae]